MGSGDHDSYHNAGNEFNSGAKLRQWNGGVNRKLRRKAGGQRERKRGKCSERLRKALDRLGAAEQSGSAVAVRRDPRRKKVACRRCRAPRPSYMVEEEVADVGLGAKQGRRSSCSGRCGKGNRVEARRKAAAANRVGGSAWGGGAEERVTRRGVVLAGVR